MQILRSFYRIFLFTFLSIIIVIIGLYTYAYLSEPIKLNILDSYYMYDNQENLIFEGNEKTKWVNLENISPNLINAVISVEDKNFYKHTGFDYLRIIKALFNNYKNKKIVEGASTISQQYIKNAFLEFNQTWSRKIKEAMMTLNLEVHYSKDEILEAYLNTINYGKGNYGIESASLYYFNKSAKDLNLEEAIMLAGIPKNPSNYNPIDNYDNALKRAKVVALSMLNNGFINNDEFKKLYTSELDLYGQKNDDGLQMMGYYQDAVLQELKSIDGMQTLMEAQGNLKVYTTLNYNFQKDMEKQILDTINDDDVQVAGIIVNPNNGEIEALTGGMNYYISTYNRALYSKRQVGSTMKPFLYYSALKNGMTSSSTFLSKYTIFNLENGKNYNPKNYNSVYPNYEITMAAAIAYSDNIYAVKTNLFLGVDELVNTAALCGIKETLKPVASLALGTTEINAISFAQGYSTFASGGYKRDLHLIRRIEDENGKILYEYEDTNNLVLNPNYVYILNELLTTTTNPIFMDYNTPTEISVSSILSQKYAIKTGTTNTDHWEVGYNKNKLIVLWTGYDDNREINSQVIMNSKKAWAKTMESVTDHTINNWYSLPENVVGIPRHAITGLATTDPNKTYIFYYLIGTEPEN